MKNLFLLLFIFLLFTNCVQASQRRVVMQNPYINNPYYRHQGYYEKEVLPRDLAALERYSMNRVYYRENPLKRLERLENLAFGSVQSGDVETRYKNVENAILSRPKSDVKRTALGALANYFAGQATGVTPSLFGNGYSYDDYGMYPYSSGYGTRKINQYSNGIFGGGYGILNNSLGNGSSIRILD